MIEIPFESKAIHPFECLKEGWELIKPHYWKFFAVVLIGAVLGGAAPFAILLGPMYCGMYLVLFKIKGGENFEIGDIFSGFNFFAESLKASLVMLIPQVLLPFIFVIPLAIVANWRQNNPKDFETSLVELTLFVMAGLLITSIFGLIAQSLFLFTYQLIVDQGITGLESLRLSARAVWHNLGGVIGLALLDMVLMFLGFLCCWIGIFFVLPIVVASKFGAYQKVFPRIRSQLTPS